MSPESQPSTSLSVLDAPEEEILLLGILGFLSHQSQRKSHLFLEPLRRSVFSFTLPSRWSTDVPFSAGAFKRRSGPTVGFLTKTMSRHDSKIVVLFPVALLYKAVALRGFTSALLQTNSSRHFQHPLSACIPSSP